MSEPCAPPLELAVERLTFGPDALARHEGQVVFLPYAVPGDRVRAEIQSRSRGFLRAAVSEVLTPGPDRVPPPCRHFGTCGGCQWQHIAPAAQRAARATVLAEQLARLGGLRDACVLAPRGTDDVWRYRGRASFAIEGRRLGYRRARSRALVEVDECDIVAPAITEHLRVARAWIDAIARPLARLEITTAPHGVVFVASGPQRPAAADRLATERVQARVPTLQGAVLTGRGKRIVVGDPTVHVPVEPDLTLEVPADVFTQVNPAANPILVAAVLELGDFSAGARVLDCFCGAGNFTLPLARRGVEVIGIERDRAAVAAAEANAARLGLTASFRACSVTHALATLGDAPFDGVILDPPRAGARTILPALTARRPPRIVYVSCDPATLARDARVLVEHGYALTRVQPVDLFPQTYHIESVAEFRLT